MNNTELWDSVEKTDPRFTKKVNQRGGFTAIGAQYQMRKATESFGPSVLVGASKKKALNAMKILDLYCIRVRCGISMAKLLVQYQYIHL